MQVRSLEQQLAGLQFGDHICLIYGDAAEKLAVAAPFVKEGLDRGGYCVYVADESTAGNTVASLVASGVDAAQALEQGALRVLTKWEHRLGLELEPQVMAEVLTELLDQALARGLNGLWLAVEMTWTLEPEVSHEQLSRWEALGNNLPAGSPAVVMCLYNRQRLASSVIQSALHTHPLVAIGRRVYPNLYYDPPEVVLDRAAQSQGVDWRLAQIQQAQESRQALGEHRQRLEALFNNALHAILLLDDSLRYVDANPAACALLGYSREELLRLTAYDLTPSHNRTLLTSLFTNFISAGQMSGEYTVLRKDGATAEVEYRATANIIPGLHMTILRDLTSRRQAELQRELQRLEALVNTSPVGVVMVDAATRQVVLANPEARRMLGASYQQGKTLEECTLNLVCRKPDGQIYELEDLPMRRSLRCGEVVRAEEIRIESADGTAITTLIDSSPVYSADGQLTTGICVLQDISPLEQLERLRGEFLAMVSHELKSPLMTIRGAAVTGLRKQGPPSAEENRELFGIIETKVEQLRSLVDNLLDTARIEAGMLSVNPEPMDVRVSLEEARNSFLRSGGTHKVALKAPDALPLVNADRQRITQVLLNLLHNASRASPAAEAITIEVNSHAEGQLVVGVHDHGRGIPEEKLAYLFKKFSRIHEDAGLSGSGLGLAICKGIVEAHGGRIWARNQADGHGTVISFSLPVAIPAGIPVGIDDYAPPSPDVEVSSPASHHGARKMRVLAVDDDPQFQYLIRRFLDESGYHPVVTGDPSQVEKLVRLEKPDLVLLDLLLPGTSGFDLLKEIRQVSDVPVIFVTARDRDEDTARALKMGAEDYITKPFSSVELAARVEAVLRRRSVPAVAKAPPSFVLGDLSIDFAGHSVTITGQKVSLTSTEYKLLYALAANSGRVLTYNQILHLVWGDEYAVDASLVHSFIRSLRRKLGDDAKRPRYIQTEPKVGYRMPQGQHEPETASAPTTQLP